MLIECIIRVVRPEERVKIVNGDQVLSNFARSTLLRTYNPKR